MSDLWDKVKTIVAGIAPILGNAIVPGVGGVAGSILAQALGVENTPDALEAKLQNPTAEDIVKIKDAANKHEEELVKVAAENDRAYLVDRQNARQREIEIVKATGKKDINLYVLAWVIMGGFFGTIIGIIVLKLMTPAVSLNNEPLLSLLLGSLSTDAGMVVGYFFGSSKGSAEKTNLLAQAQPINVNGNTK